MERRDFLTLCATTAAAASALAAAPLSAAASPTPRPVEPPSDMEGYLARVDSGVKRIREWSPTGAAPSFAGDREEVDRLARSAVEALFLTGMLGDLPIPLQLHTGMQDRMARAMPLLDEANDRMIAFLSSRTDGDLAIVQRALRDDAVRRRVIASLDEEAEGTGVSESRRAQTRSLLETVTWRLAHQPPSLFVNEYLEKVEKVAETDVESEARQRLLASRIGEAAFWETVERSARDRRIGRGAKTMGIGALVFAAGGGVVAAGAFPGVFVMTVGAVMMLVGLIILLVGLMTPQEKAAPAVSPG